MSEEIVEYIVRELGRHRKESDLIFAVARRENLNWDQAKELVEEVKIAQSTRVARRQSPLFLVIGIGTMMGGVAAAGSGGTTLYAYFRMLYDTVEHPGLDVLMMFITSLPYAPQVVYQGLALFVTGLAMIAGAAWGLGRVILDVIGR